MDETWSDENMFESEDESFEEEFLQRPKCIGCPHNRCEELLPLSGTVYCGSTPKYIIEDYYHLIEEGMKIEFECVRCKGCEDCKQTNKIVFLPITNEFCFGLRGGADSDCGEALKPASKHHQTLN